MDRLTFDREFARFCGMSQADGRFQPRREEQHPILNEDTPGTDYSFGYLVHCGWAARQLALTKPRRHVDIGSYVYFASIASAFVPEFEFYDIRRVHCPLPNLTCGSADITRLPFPTNSVESLSCLHVLEHIGLGRYGDELDAAGDRKAAAELVRVLAPGGRFLLVLPMNDQHPHVTFNSDRYYSMKMLLELFAGLKLLYWWTIWGDRIEFQNPPSSQYDLCAVFEK